MPQGSNLLVATLALLTLCACGNSSGSSSSGSSRSRTERPTTSSEGSSHRVSESGEHVVGPVAFRGEEPLVWRRPRSEMLAAEFAVREHPRARMTVSHFPGRGGTVDENVERWVGQFRRGGRPIPRSQANVERRTINDLRVTTIDVRGTYIGMSGPRARGAAGYRLLGAIVEHQRGPVFFKLTGPIASVAAAEAAFREILRTIHPT